MNWVWKIKRNSVLNDFTNLWKITLWFFLFLEDSIFFSKEFNFLIIFNSIHKSTVSFVSFFRIFCWMWRNFWFFRLMILVWLRFKLFIFLIQMHNEFKDEFNLCNEVTWWFHFDFCFIWFFDFLKKDHIDCDFWKQQDLKGQQSKGLDFHR